MGVGKLYQFLQKCYHLPVLSSVAGGKLYQFLQKYVLTLEQLEENYYPRAHPDMKGKAIIKVVSWHTIIIIIRIIIISLVRQQRNDGGGCATMRKRPESVESPGTYVTE